MVIREIKNGIYSVGSIDWDRRLFDELIPLPDGTSYNAYLVKGSKKVALIDTVDPPKTEELLENLKGLGIKEIDYVIAHHAEQDHSGAISAVLSEYRNAKIVTSPKCKEFLMNLLNISEDMFVTVKDNETLSLGDKTLQFMHMPWVHWPETMVTYLKEDRILFSCDFFGSHLAQSDLYAKDETKVYKAAKRYYAEIMMPFRALIKGHLERLKGMQLDIIAASHGPVYNKPEFILGAYREWTSDIVKNEVVIAYVSMHGSTRKMVDYLVDALMKRGITVKPHNITKTDIGELAIDLVDAATIVIATPTVHAGPHPSAVYAAFLANALRPKLRYAAIIGSYLWGGRVVEQTSGLIPNLKVEVLGTVMARGYPQENDYKALNDLADKIAEKHKSL
jgi:flavorubredoxin